LGEQLLGAALHSSFQESQLWELTLEHNFEEQLSAATLDFWSPFGKFSGTTLRNKYIEEQQLSGEAFWSEQRGTTFGVTLGTSFGGLEVFWRSFGDQFSE
jgi:hypothetical protein